MILSKVYVAHSFFNSSRFFFLRAASLTHLRSLTFTPQSSNTQRQALSACTLPPPQSKSTSQSTTTPSSGSEFVASEDKSASKTSGIIKASVTVNTEDSDTNSTSVSRRLRFSCGAFAIPHPDKQAKGGEDAYFVNSKLDVVGVFDGVGGWASLGIDPKLYSQKLSALTAHKINQYGAKFIMKALSEAVDENEHIGSSTACVVSLSEEGTLSGLNLGDSGVMVVRNSEAIYRSVDQQHYFNCPYQVGSDSADSIEEDSGIIQVNLQDGDWVVVGTDGLFDNCFAEDIVSEISWHEQKRPPGKFDPEYLAESVARLAFSFAMDTRRDTPFAVNARQSGHHYIGGKMDDITCIICRVMLNENYKKNSEL